MTPRYFSFKGSRLKQSWFYISNVQKFLHCTFLCEFLNNRSKMYQYNFDCTNITQWKVKKVWLINQRIKRKKNIWKFILEI